MRDHRTGWIDKTLLLLFSGAGGGAVPPTESPAAGGASDTYQLWRWVSAGRLRRPIGRGVVRRRIVQARRRHEGVGARLRTSGFAIITHACVVVRARVEGQGYLSISGVSSLLKRPILACRRWLGKGHQPVLQKAADADALFALLD